MPANDQYWRDLGTMHKVFAVSAFALFASTLLMMSRDETREWRDYQRQAEKLKVAKLTDELKGVNSEDLLKQVAEIEGKLKAFKASDAGKKAEAQQLVVAKAKADLSRDSTTSKFKNAERDVARANFDIAVRDVVPDDVMAQKKAAYDALQLEAEALARTVEDAKGKHDQAKEALVALTKTRDEEAAQLLKLTAERQGLMDQIELIRPSSTFVSLKRSFKEWPIINGFNPHLKIQYDWPRGLKQQLGMANVDRVDRCRSCHVNIADFAAGNVISYPSGNGKNGTYSQPFAGHPNPELYLTAGSPHSMEKFGCTVCHEGDGSGTSFQNAEHAPAHPAQAAEWEAKNHWHSNHFWEYPMFPKHLAEAACLKCHHEVTELAQSDKFGNSAPKVVEGHQIIQQYGCYGCHEINGFDGTKSIGPDLRLEPNTPEQLAKLQSDPNTVVGEMRKPGPSLRHIGLKSTPEFIAYWTADPQRFRPTTKMPKFFGNSNQADHLAEMLQPVELQAIAAYLTAKSQTLELQSPQDLHPGYVPNAENGKQLFSRRGCMACHSYDDEELKGVNADFGPDLTKIHEKIKPGVDGFKWMYSWLKQPNAYHKRTKMPDLFLNPEGKDDTYVDPAADIAAFLLAKGATEFPALQRPVTVLGVVCDEDFTAVEAAALAVEHAGVRVTEVLPGSAATRLDIGEDKRGTPSLQIDDVLLKVGSTPIRSVENLHDEIAKLHSGAPVTLTFIRRGVTLTAPVQVANPLDDLVRLYLKKALPSTDKVNAVLNDKVYPVLDEAFAKDKDGKVKSLSEFIKGDEIELAHPHKDGQFSAEEWERQKMIYIGRRTIARYGCFGCHDIPGFEDAGPIGVALQDWGRKDTAKLAPEHIEEYLHHHGEVDGSSTLERVGDALDRQKHDGNAAPADLSAAYFIDSLMHHGRAGFLWQKLRDPRSYDFKKTETKGWDERLRMPKFPFTERQIESVATFVVGLVADPPAPAFQYKPTGAKAARLEGERVLNKYNCGGCHILELPKFEFASTYDDLKALGLKDNNYQSSLGLLSRLIPTETVDPEKAAKTKSGELLLTVHGLTEVEINPDDDPEAQVLEVINWNVLKVGDKTLFPNDRVEIPASQLKSRSSGRGGDLSHWLVPILTAKDTNGIRERAWQMLPPPLVREGHKVQTQWLYQFLREPEQIRHTTVLRMPKFNMDEAEALALANYFAAVDGAEFPYQTITSQTADHIQDMQKDYEVQQKAAKEPHATHDRLTAGWTMMTMGKCAGCHKVGGREYVLTDPKTEIRGPNLDRVENRLRPDWVQLWLTNPKWVTPYTSMLQVYENNKKIYPEYYDGKGEPQIGATADALMNYSSLMDRHGKAAPLPASALPADAATAPAAPPAAN